MTRIGLIFRSVICAALLSAAAALAQQSATTPPAPTPPAILAAKKIFVSNAGGDCGLFPSPFTGDTNRGYAQFYAALKSTGQFELAADPGEADLVLELQLIAPSGPARGEVNKVNGASDPLPFFRLVVYDRKTHYILWTLTQPIDIAFLQKSHDRNFDQALTAILQDFLALSGKPPIAIR